jgi:rubrerythrin
MSNDLRPTLSELDRDGAIAEAAAGVDPVTRGAFLRRAAAITGGAIAGGALLSAGPALAATAKGDVAILNYALTLEYLESAFYREAVHKGALRGQLKQFATVVAGHEATHVQALKQALGSKAVKRPSFDFKGTTSSASTFGPTAKKLEDTGVEAYQGQATNIKAKAILTAAISIHPVEARHAAWVAAILGQQPAPAAFNPEASMSTVLKAVKATGFLGMSGASPDPAMPAQPAMTG